MKPLLLLLLAGCAFGQQQSDCAFDIGGKCFPAVNKDGCSKWKYEHGKVTYLCPKPAPKKPAKGITVKDVIHDGTPKGDPVFESIPSSAHSSPKPDTYVDFIRGKDGSISAEDTLGGHVELPVKCDPPSESLMNAGDAGWHHCLIMSDSDGGGVVEPIPNQPMIDALNKTAEAIDVPAIQETRKSDPEPPYPGIVVGICYSYDEKSQTCMQGSVDDQATTIKRQEWAILHANWTERQRHRTNHTCEDKTRILEHDEQEPPKYYCRRVQP